MDRVWPRIIFCPFFTGDTEACLLDAQQRAANLENEVFKKDANIEALVKNNLSQAESAVQAQNVMNFKTDKNWGKKRYFLKWNFDMKFLFFFSKNF